MELTITARKRLEQLPRALHAEFPWAPLELIEHDLERRVHELARDARFDEFVPLLARRTVRARLRAGRRPPAAAAYGGARLAEPRQSAGVRELADAAL